MAQVFAFGRDDLARIRFTVSPLWEVMSALRVLVEPQRRAYHLPWLDAVRPDLDRLDLAPLLLLSPRRGWTRAALLESLAEPASTHTLASRHELAASTVSEHLAALHDARLVIRRRHRHAALYQRTPLGTELAVGDHQQPGTTQATGEDIGQR